MEKLKDIPVNRHSPVQALSIKPAHPMYEKQRGWESVAQSVVIAQKFETIDKDSPDPQDLVEKTKIPVDNSGTPMVFDPKSETWFPITVVLPGNNPPAPAAPPVDEKKRRQQLITVFAAALILLLITLYFISKKK